MTQGTWPSALCQRPLQCDWSQALNSMISPKHIDLMRSTHSPPHSADNDQDVAAGMRFGLGFRLSYSGATMTRARTLAARRVRPL